jgi:hypothetical protein
MVSFAVFYVPLSTRLKNISFTDVNIRSCFKFIWFFSFLIFQMTKLLFMYVLWLKKSFKKFNGK